MAQNQNITVDADKVAEVVTKMQDKLSDMRSDAKAYGAAFLVVQQRNPDITQVNEIIEISEALCKDIADADEALTLLVQGIRQYEEQLREAFSGHVDVD